MRSQLWMSFSRVGGFYAAWLAGRTGIRAVLLNPAVEPWDIVKLYNGEYKSFTGDKIVRVTPDYADQLRALDAKSFADPARVLMVLCTGDEVLDWRRAAKRFSDVQSIVIDGSDHRISCFDTFASGCVLCRRCRCRPSPRPACGRA